MLIFLILMLVQSADGIVQTAPAVVAPAPATDPCRFGRGRISSPNCPPGPPRVFVSDTPQPAPAAEAEEDTNPWAIVRDARFENTNTNQTSPEPSERPAGRFDWSARTQGAEGYAAAGYDADGTLRATSTPASDTTVPQAAFTDPDKWIGEQCAGQIDTAETDCRRRARNRLAMARADAAAGPVAGSEPRTVARAPSWTPDTPAGPCRQVSTRTPTDVFGTTTSSTSTVCTSGNADALLDSTEARLRDLRAMPATDCGRPLSGEDTTAWMARCERPR